MKNYIHIFMLSTCLLSCAKDFEVMSDKVQEGEFLSTLTESGELLAVNSIGITVPFIGWKYGWRYKIIGLSNHGDIISEGDTVAIIDPSPVVKILQEEQNKLEIEQANLNKLLASHKSILSQLYSELATGTANYNLIQLQVDKFKFEPEPKQKIKALELEIAEVKQNRVKRKTILQKVIMKNQINIQKTKITRLENSINAAELALSKLIITTPINGIAQLEANWRTDKMVQLGDNTGQGWPLISVPDLSTMKVSGAIIESDIYKLRLGQIVNVRLDAYPTRKFSGEISHIGKLSRKKEEGSDIKVFDFEVIIKDSDPALKPGMTVSCEIILAALENTLFVSNDCIYHNGGNYYIVKKNENNNEKTPIKILGRNSKYTAISAETKQGDRLISSKQLLSSNSD